MAILYRDIKATNRRSWDQAIRAHNTHKGDPVPFFRAGKSCLFPEDKGIIGRLKGKRILHPLCNDGREALSMSNLGAKALGIDFSDEAIQRAISTGKQVGSQAVFVNSEIYDWFESQSTKYKSYFDVVFLSLGSLWWLHDIGKFFQHSASVLAPTGFVAIVDFHPVVNVLDDHWNLKYDYFDRDQPYSEQSGIQDYYAQCARFILPWPTKQGTKGFSNATPVYEYYWTMSDIVMSLKRVQFQITYFREYPFVNGESIFPSMRRRGRRFYPPKSVPNLPLMFALRAETRR